MNVEKRALKGSAAASRVQNGGMPFVGRLS